VEGKKLGFGFMRLPYIYSPIDQKTDIDLDAVCAMVDEYLASGYKYFETAKPYMSGRSEDLVRHCLSERYERGNFVLADKLPYDLADGANFDKVFEGQLQRCGVSYFDVYYIHNMGKRILEKYERMGAFEFLKRMKQEGRALKIGFSFHDTADVLEEVLSRHPEVDIVQLQLNYWDWESPIIQSRKCYETARKFGKRIFVMEPLKGGALAELPEDCVRKLQQTCGGISPVEFAFRFLASLDGVDVILSGMSDIAQVRDNARIFSSLKGLSEPEKDVVKEIVDALDKHFKIPCTACGYCTDKCPAKIKIPQIFRLYNSYGMAAKTDRTALGRHRLLYKSIHGGAVSECIDCGQCERSCPQRISVRKYLIEADDMFREKKMYTVIKSVQIVIALLKKFNIRHLVLSPGTRNIPFVHSVELDPYFKCYSVVDERSAAHFAIGMAQELGEPVLISCTSSSACCNYLPAVTEAYYQGIPLVILTGDRDPRREGQMEDQMIHQYGMYRDVCKRYVQLPDVVSDEDFWYCERLVNEALLELNHHGKGPVHINIPVFRNLSQYTAQLPQVRAITRHETEDEAAKWDRALQSLGGVKKVMIVYGQCSFVDPELAVQLERFAECYNSVIIAEHMANLECKYALNPYILFDAASEDRFPEELLPDLVITMGGRVASHVKSVLRAHHDKLIHWEVNESGEIIDVFRSLTDIFECSPSYFLRAALNAKSGAAPNIEYYKLWKKYAASIVLRDIPYSNVYAIREFLKEIPENTILHLSILNSVRITQFFELKKNIKVYANIGAHGIDGALSTFLGHSAASEKLCFLIVGDLSFFYDMNAAWIRHIGSNVRILLINNGGGGEFHFTFGEIIPETVDQFIAAGHEASARAWIESRGFEYLTASNEAELTQNMQNFVAPGHNRPVLFEVFTDKDIDGATVRNIFKVNRNEVLDIQRQAELSETSRLYAKYLFPYDKLIGQGNRLVIYGAGDVGKSYYAQASKNENCAVVAWIDRNARELKRIGMPVDEISVLKELKFDAVVIGIKEEAIARQVKQNLIDIGIPCKKIIWSVTEVC